MNKSKVTSKGRQVIKPKKILTTSSDENINKRRKITKRKPIQINKALHNLALKAAKIKHPIFKQANYKQVHNSNVKENASKPSYSTNETRSLSIGSVIDLNSNTMIHEDTNRSVLGEIVHANNHSNRMNTIDCSKNNVTATSSLQNIDRPVFSSGHNNAVSQDQRSITDHSLQNSENKSSTDASSSRSVTDSEEKNISFQNDVIKLLNTIVDQNKKMYDHIKSLQSINKMETAQEHLYNRPDGLPLATVEEFESFESDTASLHNLISLFITYGNSIQCSSMPLVHIKIQKNIDENDRPKSPSLLFPPYLKKRPKQLAFHPIKNEKLLSSNVLNGQDCWECKEYYKNLLLSKEELQKRLNQCSRHRRKYEQPNTPEGFWDPDFPTLTQ